MIDIGDGVAVESQDREQWGPQLQRHMAEKVQDSRARAQTAAALRALRDRLAGCPPSSKLSMSVLLRARAKLKAGKAPGPDHVTVTMIKNITWASLRRVLVGFQMMYERRIPCPEGWREISATLMPKEAHIEDLKDTRVLCMQSVVMKWYMSCIVTMIEERIEHSHHYVQLYGFRPDRKISEITSVLKRVSQHAAVWGKADSLFLANLDILQAFDHVSPLLALRCMEELQIPQDLIHALLDPLADNRCVANFEGVQTPDPVMWDKSIRTGGVGGPLIFLMVSIVLWRNVVEEWRAKETVGYQLESGTLFGKDRITHTLWADNLLLYAHTREDLSDMIRDMSIPLLEAGLTWKPKSFQYMYFGAPPGIPPTPA